MEILKRARGHSDGDVLPFNADKKDIQEELNRRTYKAGYTNSHGGPVSSGKGDTYRPVNKKKYDENYKRIFGHD